MLSRPIMLAATLLTAASAVPLCSCSCGENYQYAATTTLEDEGVKIPLRVEAIVTSGYTRNGLLTTKKYRLTLTYPGRGSLEINNYAGKEILSHEALKKRIKTIALRLAPNRKHFAIDPGPFGERIHILHLLPAGNPFRLETFDKQAKVKRLSEIDWEKMSPPLEIARQSMRARVGKGEFCIDSDLGTTLAQNIKSRRVAEAVLEFWPDCKDAHWKVSTLIKLKSTPRGLLELVWKRADAYLDRPKPAPHALSNIADACRMLGDKRRLDRVYRAALPHWPANYDVHSGVFNELDKAPPDVKKALTRRAKKILKNAKSPQHEKDMAKTVLGRYF